MPKFHLGGKLDLGNPSLFGNILNKSSMQASFVPSTTSNNPPYSIPSTNNVSHSGLVSTSLSSDNHLVLSCLPLSVGASNTNTFHGETARICIPHSDSNPFQSSTSVLETDRNPLDNPIPILDSHVPQNDLCTMGENYTMNPLETNMDHMSRVPSTKDYSHYETNMNQTDWIPSIENYVYPEIDMNIIALETNTNQMGGIFSGESYVPPENMIPSEININQMSVVSYGEIYNLPQDMISAETNTTHVDFVSCEIPSETNISILKTSTNQMDCAFAEENHVLLENMTSCETNTTQVGLVPCETSYPALDNVNPIETNIEEMELVPYEEGYNVPIEDLISFDIDVNEMDMHSWLENHGSSERNIFLSTSNLGHDSSFSTLMGLIPQTTMHEQENRLAMHLGSTSQQHMESYEYQNIEAMNQREDMEGGKFFHNDREFMDWIDEILNEDA